MVIKIPLVSTDRLPRSIDKEKVLVTKQDNRDAILINYIIKYKFISIE